MKLVKGIWFPDYDTHFENVIDNEGNYQRKQFDTVMKYIKPKNRGLFIDVGAHVGLWSRMAQKAGFINILSIEPDLQNFECLQANLVPKNDENGFILGYNIAMSDEFEDIQIVSDKSDNSGAKSVKNGGEIPAMKFDLIPLELFSIIPSDRLAQNIDKTLVKIDVQGYEVKVVRGMSKFIKKYKPIIVIEQWLNGKEDLEATHYCESLGMKILEKVEKEVILGW